MAALALLLRAHEQTGSYAVAGMAATSFALALAASSPWYGRLLARGNVAATLVASGVLAAVSRTALGLLPLSHVALLLVAAGAGASSPPLQTCLRVLFSRLPDDDTRRSALALEGSLIEVIYLVGPLLVAATVPVSPGFPLVLSGVMCLAGAVGTASNPAVRALRLEPPPDRRAGALAYPGVRLLLVPSGLVTLGLAGIDVAVAAYATSRGAPGLAGALLALLSVSSLLSGLRYGALTQRSRLSRRLAGYSTLVAVGATLAVTVHLPVLLAACLVAAGIGLAPALTAILELIGVHAPDHARAAAYAWGSTANGLGTAVGSTLAGFLVVAGGPAAGFALAAAASTLIAAVAMTAIARLDHPARPRTA
jgi:MFS family permease